MLYFVLVHCNITLNTSGFLRTQVQMSLSVFFRDAVGCHGAAAGPLQLAHQANRSAEENVNMGLHYNLQSLHSAGTYGHVLLADFSSVFNITKTSSVTGGNRWCWGAPHPALHTQHQHPLKTVTVELKRRPPPTPTSHYFQKHHIYCGLILFSWFHHLPGPEVVLSETQSGKRNSRGCGSSGCLGSSTCLRNC